jgi:hypothetical protein
MVKICIYHITQIYRGIALSDFSDNQTYTKLYTTTYFTKSEIHFLNNCFYGNNEMGMRADR